MKKFLFGFVVFVAVVVGAAYALLRAVSIDNLQRQLVEKVKEQTGRDISFETMSPAFFFPNIGLRLRHVTFSNASWAHDKNMLELGELDLHLALKPLLDHQIVIASLSLVKPVVHLETSAEGQGNWELAKPAKEKPAGAAPGGASGASDIASSFGYKFGQMRLTGGGIVTWRDGKKGTVDTFDGVNASLTYPDFASPLQMDGELNYKGKRVNVLLNLTKPIDFLHGKASDGDLTLKGEGFSIRAMGNLATAQTLFSGRAIISLSALSDLAGWLQGSATKLPFENVSLDSNVTASQTTVSLAAAKLKLDDVNANGNVTATLKGRPNVQARFDLDHIDLDKFVEASKGTAAAKGETPKEPKQTEDWSTAPMDFGGLKKFDADLILVTKGFAVRGAEVGTSALAVLLKDGVLDAKNTPAAMFGGSFGAELTVNAAQDKPTFATKFKVDGVQAKPLFAAFGKFKRLEGAAYMEGDLTASGDNQKAIMTSLTGKGTFDFKNGAIQGIDLGNLSKLIQLKLKEIEPSDAETQFTDVHGTYTIAAGVLHNDDLKLSGPVVQSTGSGTVDFGGKSIDYHMLPVLSPSTETDKTKGLTVPVSFEGPFGKIRIRPDFKAALHGALGKPEDAKDTIKALQEQGKSVVKELRQNPKAIDQLLGGLFKKKKSSDQQQAPDATAPQPDNSQPAPDAGPPGNSPPPPAPNGTAQPQPQ